jgi:hypothetical protein
MTHSTVIVPAEPHSTSKFSMLRARDQARASHLALCFWCCRWKCCRCPLFVRKGHAAANDNGEAQARTPILVSTACELWVIGRSGMSRDGRRTASQPSVGRAVNKESSSNTAAKSQEALLLEQVASQSHRHLVSCPCRGRGISCIHCSPLICTEVVAGFLRVQSVLYYEVARQPQPYLIPSAPQKC